MTGRSCWGLLVLVTTTSLGCAMCASPFDYDYAAFGTVHPRSDQRFGRVGSALETGGPIEVEAVAEYPSGELELDEPEGVDQHPTPLDQGPAVDLQPATRPAERSSPSESVIVSPPDGAMSPSGRDAATHPSGQRPQTDLAPEGPPPKSPKTDDLELPEI